MTVVEYSSNNSGGNWWLDDDDWVALEKAGWTVNWVKDETPSRYTRRADEDGRWIGALATTASREGLSMREAIAEWEAVTGESSSALGCSCCGTPHTFSDDEGNYYSPEFPAYGDSY